MNAIWPFLILAAYWLGLYRRKPKKVYIVEGWFGDHDWREAVFADQVDADILAAKLWETRTSENAPEWMQGYCKFAVEEVDVE